MVKYKLDSYQPAAIKIVNNCLCVSNFASRIDRHKYSALFTMRILYHLVLFYSMFGIKYYTPITIMYVKIINYCHIFYTCCWRG